MGEHNSLGMLQSWAQLLASRKLVAKRHRASKYALIHAAWPGKYFRRLEARAAIKNMMDRLSNPA